MKSGLKERLASLRTKAQQTPSEYLAYKLLKAVLISRELSSERIKMTAQTKTLTTGVRQFIQDHLAGILLAESKGANPGQPLSLPKKKRARDEDDEAAEKGLTSRMVTLVEVPPSGLLFIFIFSCGNWRIDCGRN